VVDGLIRSAYDGLQMLSSRIPTSEARLPKVVLTRRTLLLSAEV